MKPNQVRTKQASESCILVFEKKVVAIYFQKYNQANSDLMSATETLSTDLGSTLKDSARGAKNYGLHQPVF